MRVDWLSLGAVQSLLRTDTPIPTKDAILIDVNAVANFQIASETMTVDENGKQVKALENAAKNYLNQSKERMEKDVTQVLLGKLREVIGRTELKALMENRDTFAATVAESARVDMERLGLQLTTFNIQDFTDRQNVIANMGAEMAAEISRNAKLASINAEQDVAVRQNQLDLKRAELQSISDKAQAEADAVKGITTTDKNHGVITLKGLYGDYTVTEIKSPFGGSILPEFTLTVGVAQSQDHNTSTSSLTAFGQDSNKLASKSSDDGVTVINARNIADMPKTGAVWLSIFGVMTVLLAGASALLLRRKA